MSGIISQNVGRTSGLVKAVAAAGGTWTLIETITASSDSTIDFDSSIDSTYPIYLFKIINLHASTNNTKPMVNFRDGSTAYDATKTTTHYSCSHNEADDQTWLQYETGGDLAESTGDQTFFWQNVSNVDDAGANGELFLFSPSSTTFVKHFIGRMTCVANPVANGQGYIGGYCNTTAAIDGVQFKMNSGTIDAGTFKMYGLGDS